MTILCNAGLRMPAIAERLVVQTLSNEAQLARLAALGKSCRAQASRISVSVRASYGGGYPLAVKWELLLHDEDLAVIRPLLEAAHAHPRLRQLSPSISHRTVLFLESNPEDRSKPMIKILRTRDGRFQLEGTDVSEPQQAVPLEEVLAHAASAMP